MAVHSAKRRRSLLKLSAAVCALPALTLPSSAFAEDRTWNGSVDNSWGTPGNWTLNFVPTSVDDALFPATSPFTARTITLDPGSVANGLQFDNIDTFTGGSLNLTSGTIDVALGSSASIGTQLTGSGGLTKTGYGALSLLNAANNYTGTTTISFGAVQINSAGALGSDSSAILITGNQTRGVGGGQLGVGGTYASPVTLTRAINVTGGGPTGDGIALYGIGTNFNGAVTTGATAGTRLNANFGANTLASLTTGAAQTTQLTGQYVWDLASLSGGGTLQKSGNGTLLLNGNHSGFNGVIQTNSGFLRVANVAALGTSTANNAIQLNGGTLELRTAAPTGFATKSLTLNTSTTVFVDHAVGDVGAATLNQTVTFGNYFVGSNNLTTTYNGRNGWQHDYNGSGGNIALATGNPSTFTSNANGLVTLDANITSSDTTVRTFTFNANGEMLVTGNLNFFSGVITHGMNKGGTGTLSLGGTSSTLLGATSINAGTLSIGQFGAINAAGGTLNIGTGGTFAILDYRGAAGTGAGETTGKVINLAGTTGWAIIDANQAGSAPTALVLTGNMTASGAGTKNLVLGGANALDNTVSGNIIDNGGANLTRLVKAGTGTWVLSNGALGFTGGVTVSGGVLGLQAVAGGAANQIVDTNNLTFNVDQQRGNTLAGGVFQYRGFSTGSSETLGQLIPTAGAGTVQIVPGASGTTSLTFASLGTFGSGATLNFAVPATHAVNVTGASGFLNARAYYNGADFAYGDAGLLRAPVYDTDAGFVTAGASLTTASHNLLAGNVSQATPEVVQSLKFGGAHTLSLDPAAIVTLQSGGILAAGGASAITGDATSGITTAGTTELAVRVNGPGDTLTIGAPLLATSTGGLTKSGEGTLVLTAANTYIGATTVNEGVLRIGAGGSLGTTASNLVVRQGGTFDLGGNAVGVGAFNGAGTVTNSDAAQSILTIGNGVTATSGVVFLGVMQDGAGRLGLTKVGAGSAALTGLNTYQGPTTLTAGILQANTLDDIGVASSIGRGDATNAATNAASLVFNGGTLLYTGANGTIYQQTQTPSVATNRLFTLAGNGTIDSSGGRGNVATGGVTLATNDATLVFSNAAPVSFNGAGARTLTLQGVSTGDNAVNLQLVNNPNAGESLNVTKAGTGLWHLTNTANSYSGNTTITAGALQAMGSALPASSPLVLNGGVFQTSGEFTRSLGVGAGLVNWTAGGGFSSAGDKLVVAIGGVATPADLTWASGGFVPTGNLVLSSTSALGEVEFRNNIALGTATRTVNVDDNGTTSTDYATISGVISGGAAGNLTKGGSGNLVLAGANTYIGNTNVNAGSLTVFSIDGAGGSSSVGNAGGTLNIGTGGTGATLFYVGAGETVNRPVRAAGTTGGAVIDAGGSGALVLNDLLNTGAGAKSITLQGVNNDQNRVTSVLANQGANVLSVTKSLGGTWILTGNNTYTGTTTHNSGYLGLGSDSAIGTGTLSFNDATVFAYGGDRSLPNNVTLNGGTAQVFMGDYSLAFSGTLQLTGGTRNIDNFIVDDKAFMFSGNVNLQETTNNRTMNIRGTGTTIFSGLVQNGGTANGSLAVNGPGATLQLSGSVANTYSGTTTITNGTLRLGGTSTDLIPDGTGKGNVVMNPGTTATATLDVNGKNETVNGLTATSAGPTVIDNTSATPATLTFGANDAAVTISGAQTQIKSTGGPLSLVKTGAGTATISNGTHTYTGSTTAEGGIFNINRSLNGTSGLLATGTGVLNVNQPATLGTTGTIASANTGVVNLNAVVTLGGNTSLTSTGGSVNVLTPIANPASVNAVTVGAGGTVNLADGAAQSLALTTLNLGAGTGIATLGLNLGANTAASDSLNLTGVATTANTVRFNFTTLAGYGSAATTYDLISASGGGLNAATYEIGTLVKPAGYTANLIKTDTLVQLDLALDNTPITHYWRGAISNSWVGTSGSDVNFTTDLAGTVNAGAVPGPTTTLIFSSTAAPLTAGVISTTLDANFAINALEFTAAPAGVTAVNIAPGSSSTNTLSIAPAASTAGISVAADAGNITISAPVQLAANQTWNVDGTGVNGSSLTASSALTGSGNLIKTGAGVATVQALSPNFDGNLTLQEGTLSLKSGTGGSGAVLNFGAGGGANLTVTGNATLDVGNFTPSTANQGNVVALGGFSIGSQTLTVTGSTPNAGLASGNLPSFRLQFNGPSTISGNATINMGTTGGTLPVFLAAPMTLAGQVTSTGNTVTVGGIGVPHAALRLSNTSSATPNNITGEWVVGPGGTLETRTTVGGVNNGGSSLGTAAITLSGGTLRIGSHLNSPITGADGFTARYYQSIPAGNDLSTLNSAGVPTGSNTTAVINAPTATPYTAGAGMTGLPAGVANTNFSALFTGVLNVTTAGYYGFHSASDDGTQLYIDGSLVANNNFNHGQPGQMPWGTIYLEAGQHLITERFYQGTGGGAAVLRYSGPDTGNTLALVGSIAGWVVTPDAPIATTFAANPVTVDGSSNSGIEISVNTALPTLSLTIGTGATLNVTSTGDVSTLSVSGATTVAGDVTFNTPSAHLTLAGAYNSGGGAFAFTKDGAGTLTVNGFSASAATNHSGLTSINGGTLLIPNVSPSFTGGLAFGVAAGTTTTAGRLDLAGNSATFGGRLAVQTNTTATNELLIGAGQTLSFGGDVVIGSNHPALTTTNVTATGGGTLTVNNLAANGSFVVGGVTNAANQGSRTTADFSGLSTLNITLNTTNGIVRVNPTSGSNVAGRFSTFLLPPTTNIEAASLNVGDSAQLAGTATPAQRNAVVLGSGISTFKLETVNIGTGGRDIGSIAFGSASGSLSIQTATGGRTAFNMGTGTATTGVSAADGNIFDVTGHQADLLLGAVSMGTQGGRTSNLNNTFSFDQGTLDMLALTMSTKTATTAVATTSTLNIGGGTVKIASADLAGASAAGGTANATMNLTGGTTTLAGNIVRIGGAGTTSATVNVAGGTLDMGTFNIGGATAGTDVNNFILASGSLGNVGEVNAGAAFSKVTDGSPTGGTLTIFGTNNWTGPLSITAGSVMVNGSITSAAAAVTVTNASATVGGSGSIAGPLTMTAGTLSPGNSVGTISVGSLALTSASNLLAELASDLSGDKVTVAGDSTGSNAHLQIALLDGYGPVNASFTLIDNAGVSATPALFKDVQLVDGGNSPQSPVDFAFQGGTIWSATDGGGNLFTIDYGAGVGSNDVVLTISAVPEPASVALLAMAGIGLLGRRRRR